MILKYGHCTKQIKMELKHSKLAGILTRLSIRIVSRSFENFALVYSALNSPVPPSTKSVLREVQAITDKNLLTK